MNLAVKVSWLRFSFSISFPFHWKTITYILCVCFIYCVYGENIINMIIHFIKDYKSTVEKLVITLRIFWSFFVALDFISFCLLLHYCYCIIVCVLMVIFLIHIPTATFFLRMCIADNPDSIIQSTNRSCYWSLCFCHCNTHPLALSVWGKQTASTLRTQTF